MRIRTASAGSILQHDAQLSYKHTRECPLPDMAGAMFCLLRNMARAILCSSFFLLVARYGSCHTLQFFSFARCDMARAILCSFFFCRKKLVPFSIALYYQICKLTTYYFKASNYGTSFSSRKKKLQSMARASSRKQQKCSSSEKCIEQHRNRGLSHASLLVNDAAKCAVGI